MPRTIYVNGQYQPYHDAQIHVEDRGFQFGDAVYEVVACIHGHLADERGHLDRLERSLDELRINMPVSRESLRFLMRETLRRNRLTNAGIYLQVSRGVARRDFKFPNPETPPTLVIMAFAIDFDGNPYVEKGICIKTLPDIRWPRRDIKTTLLFPQSWTKQLAIDEGCDEAWMIDDKGMVTEGTSNNAWILTDDNKLLTRPVSHDILRGITRTAIEKICSENDITIVEQSFSPKQAYEAKEAFISSANTIATPVVEIDGHKIGDGKRGDITKKIYEEYRAYVEGLRGEQVRWEAGL